MSALLSSLLVILIIVTPLMFLTVALTNELASTARSLPVQVAQLLNPETPVTGKLSEWIHDHLAVDALSSSAFIVEQLKNAGAVFLQQSVGVMGNIISGFVKAFFVIFTMYYLFRDGDKIVRALPGVLPQ